ncbi:hypothetical protein HanIR_Chr09g0417841 [Helianthus annuus]|nr:hypothetical protein HanIR_Chr09g0417841 [Helianthus annuus]
MTKGPVYSRRVNEGGATLPAAIGRQLSDQGQYPLGLLCCGQDSSTRRAPIFVHAGEIVQLLSVCPRICCRSTWRLINGDTCLPFCRKEHLWCHLDAFQKFLEASGFTC